MTAPRPNFLDALFGPNTEEFRGLLTPESQQAARRRSLLDAGLAMMSSRGNFGSTIATGVQAGREGYNSVIGERVAGQEMQQKQALQSKRAEIARRFASQPGETPEQIDNRLRAMMGELINAGMTDDARSISEYLKSRGGGQERTPGSWITTKGPDGRPMRRYVTAEEAGQQGVEEYRAPVERNEQPRLVQITDPETGMPVWAEHTASTGFRSTGVRTAGQPSEAERKNGALLQLATPMFEILDAADAPTRLEGFAKNGNLNEMLSADRQIYDNAGRMIMDGYLRLTTGAAYNKEEMNNAHQMLVPMPGDKLETIAVKRRMRSALASALRTAAGRAAPVTQSDLTADERAVLQAAGVLDKVPKSGASSSSGNAQNVRDALARPASPPSMTTGPKPFWER